MKEKIIEILKAAYRWGRDNREGRSDKNFSDIQEIGYKIKKARKEQGLSQSAVCELTGFDRKTLYRLEFGSPNLVIKNVSKILSVFGYYLTIKPLKS